MTSAQASAWDALKYDWQDAYSLAIMDDGYCAARRDHPSAVLRADSIDGLREQIRADYESCPVPREIGDRS